MRLGCLPFGHSGCGCRSRYSLAWERAICAAAALRVAQGVNLLLLPAVVLLGSVVLMLTLAVAFEARRVRGVRAHLIAG